MSRKGNPLDNATVAPIFEYFEFYNRERLHSSLTTNHQKIMKNFVLHVCTNWC